MTSLIDRIVAIDVALADADVPHAFGGALALAWCTERARGTIDIDLNVFVGPDQAVLVLDVLPDGIRKGDEDLEALRRDGQVRLWWDGTPVDLFLNTTEFHRAAADRVQREWFAGREVPFLGCSDLAVFTAGTLDVDRLPGVLVRYVGNDDERIARLQALLS